MKGSGFRVVLWVVFWVLLVGMAAFGLTITIQSSRFERQVHREAHALLGRDGTPPAPPIAPDRLPPPVRRYLEAVGATVHAPVLTVRLRHGGTFQPAAEGPAYRVRGEQYFTADPPGFVWWGRIRVAPGLWIDGRDRSIDGEGNMLIRAVSTFTLADARGTELDEAALQRLLGELAWLPTSLLDDRWVRWEPVDATTARARLRVAGREATLTWHFGADGLPVRVDAERWRDAGGKAVRTPWAGELGDWRDVDGLKVPYRMAATWVIGGKPLTYARWEVQQLELGATEPF